MVVLLQDQLLVLVLGHRGYSLGVFGNALWGHCSDSRVLRPWVGPCTGWGRKEAGEDAAEDSSSGNGLLISAEGLCCGAKQSDVPSLSLSFLHSQL